MPKPPRVDRPVEKKLSLPRSLVVQVELELYSELEGKVPFGEWSMLIEDLLRNWLVRRDDERNGK